MKTYKIKFFSLANEPTRFVVFMNDQGIGSIREFTDIKLYREFVAKLDESGFIRIDRPAVRRW